LLFAGDSVLNGFTIDGALTIELPFALNTSETGAGAWVFHVAGDGKRTRMTWDRRYDSVKARAVFKTNHLSTYANV
jgi:hypothetical protein